MASDDRDLPSVGDSFSAFVRALPVAVYTTDAAGFVTSFNPAAAALAGRSPVIGQDRWCVTWRLYWPDGRSMPHEECPMALALRQNRIIRGAEAIAERPNGTRFTFRPYPTPIRDDSGQVVAGINVLIETTERQKAGRAQPAAAAALDGRLFAVLRLIDAVLVDAQQQAHGAEARLLIAAVTQRIAAISVTQGFLNEPTGDSRVGSWDLLSATCVLVQPSLPKGVELHCESTASDLAGETALPLAIIARELIASAAQDRQSGGGIVQVALQKESAGSYLLTVSSDAHASAAPARSFELVAALARQLNGEFAVESGAIVRYVLRFPDPRTLH